ncbi:MAG TPA: hypothetical protein VLW50_20000 [Streptosporangiaceae bacterium]|nr:hypothetical protein [Streptosporangiaceae bacterium]
MSPTAIEGLLVEHRLIGQALAFGGRQPLPTLDGEVAPLGEGAWHRGAFAGRTGPPTPR